MRAGSSRSLLVAVIGRPNVGKSTLVNRLIKRRASIVSPSSELTRDRLEREIAWRGRSFLLVDTGGLAGNAIRGSGTLRAHVAEKALAATREADLVVFVVDASETFTSDDFDIAQRIRKLSVPLILVANKVDDVSQEIAAGSEAWSLGLGEPLIVSALHGRGTGELLDRIVDTLPSPGSGRAGQAELEASVAIVGRPNVGKSSLFNLLVGSDRAIVHKEPGTTRDSVDTVVEIGGRRYRFVDTAGLRRRAKTAGVEIYGASRTRESIARADVAILVVDSSEGATGQDQRIAEAVADAGVGAVVAANKWDLITDDEMAAGVETSISERLHFVSYAPLVRTSAVNRRGLAKLIREIDNVLAARSVRVPTAGLNVLIQEAQQRTPAPRSGSRNPRILYATQAETAPPTFVLFTTARPPAAWLRFIEHRLRDEFGFSGNPVRLVVRGRARRADDKRASRRS